MIGDKPKWFAQSLPAQDHSAHEGSSTLVAAIAMTDDIAAQSDSDAPTDESGNYC